MPAFCDSCGLIFKSPIALGNNVSNVSIQGAKVVCPNCRNIARIPDGIYNSIKNGIEFVSGPDISVKRLKDLSQVIQNIRDQNLTNNEVEKIIKEDAPELQKLADVLPKTRNELYAFLAIILSILTLLISQCESGEEKNINITNVTNHYNQNYTTKNRAKIIASDKNKKIGRNEKCPCGSDLKFKKCHGKNN